MAQTKVEQLVTALVGPAQDIENMLQQMLLNRALATATGVQLDLIGRVVNQPRNGLSDDDYRRYLRARVATSRSGGTTEELLNIVKLIVNDTTGNMVIRVTQEGTATARLFISGIALTDALAAIVFTFVAQAKAAGVRIVVEWSDSLPANTFTLDAGPGLDQGHLAGALG